MTEKAGRIEYEFAAETDGVLKAGTVVNKATDGMVKSFGKVDKSVKTLNTQMTKTAQSVRSARPDIQNISYQLQDMAVQAQMGTSAFVIMSQQLPQMLAGMGAFAGVVGFAITALGLMATTLVDTTTSAERLEKSIEQVKAIMTIGANGVANYSEELQELNRVSENLTKIKLAIALTDNQKALSGIRSEFASLRSSLFNFQEDSGEAAKRLTGLASKASEITGLASSLQALTKVTDDDSKLALLDSIEERLLSLRNADGSFPTSDLKAFADEFFTLSNNTRQAVEQNKLLKQSQDGLIDSGKNTGEAFEQQRIALKTQRIELEQGQLAAYKYALLMSGDFTAAQIESLIAMKQTNDGLIEQDRLRKQASDALEDEIDGYIRLGEEVTKAEERKAAAAQREKDRLAQRGTTVGLTQTQTIETRFESDLEALKAAREQQLITEQEYANREIELQRQKTEAINNLNNDVEESYKRIGEAAASSISNYLAGVDDAETATRKFKAAIIQEVVGSLITMGTQALVQMLKTKVASKTAMVETATTATATTAATTAAQAAATTTVSGIVGGIAGGLAAAWAPAAAFASLATLGANAAPAIAGIVSTMGATLATQAVGGLLSNAITAKTGFSGPSMNYGGGRQYGGPVSQGMYRVNETGVPEIYSHGGKDYLMNTKNANIKPLEQSGGGGMQVIVNNNTPYEVFVTQDQAANIANIQIGREASKAAKGQGTLLKGVMAGTNTTKRARN